MRFREYVADLDADAHRALVDDLTLGAGRMVVAVRRHREDPSTLSMLTTLAGAFASLHAAVVALGDQEDEAAAPPTTAPIDRLAERWTSAIAPANVHAVGALLLMAAEMARDAAHAALNDREVATVRGLLRDALDLLTQVRDDALRSWQAPLSDKQP